MALTATVHATKPTVGGDINLWGGEINSDLDYFDRSINGVVVVNIPDANVVLVADGTAGDQSNYAILQFAGALTADRTVTLPANTKLAWALNNTTGGHSIIIKNPTGPTLALPISGGWVRFWSNGASITDIPQRLTVVAANSAIKANFGNNAISMSPAGMSLSMSYAGTAIFDYLEASALFAWGYGATTPMTLTGAGVLHTIGAMQAPAFTIVSDYRLKVTFGEASVGALIDAVPVYDAELKARSGVRSPMFLAHELQEVCPWAVIGEKDAVHPDGSPHAQQINQQGLIPLLWAELRALRRRVADLEQGVVR